MASKGRLFQIVSEFIPCYNVTHFFFLVNLQYSQREVIIKANAVDEIDERHFIAIKMTSDIPVGGVVPLPSPQVERVDFDGAMLLRPCPRSHELLLKSNHVYTEPVILVSFKMFVDPHMTGIPTSVINFITRTVIGTIWAMFLTVAEDVRSGKRPQHEQAIVAKKDFYDWMAVRISILLERAASRDPMSPFCEPSSVVRELQSCGVGTAHHESKPHTHTDSLWVPGLQSSAPSSSPPTIPSAHPSRQNTIMRFGWAGLFCLLAMLMPLTEAFIFRQHGSATLTRVSGKGLVDSSNRGPFVSEAKNQGKFWPLLSIPNSRLDTKEPLSKEGVALMIERSFVRVSKSLLIQLLATLWRLFCSLLLSFTQIPGGRRDADLARVCGDD
jgi:hypothetical protein